MVVRGNFSSKFIISLSFGCLCLFSGCSRNCKIEHGDVIKLNDRLSLKVDTQNLRYSSNLATWNSINSEKFNLDQLVDLNRLPDPVIPLICSDEVKVVLPGDFASIIVPSDVSVWELNEYIDKKSHNFVQALEFEHGYLAVYRNRDSEGMNLSELWHVSKNKNRLVMEESGTIVLVKFDNKVLVISSNYAHGAGDTNLFITNGDSNRIISEVAKYEDEFREYGFNEMGNFILVCQRSLYVIDYVDWNNKLEASFETKLSGYSVPVFSKKGSILLGMHGCILEVTEGGEVFYRTPED